LRRATSQASATFEAQVAAENMLSPKKAPPSFTPHTTRRQARIMPAFNRVGMAEQVKPVEACFDLGVDPGLVAL
jgi:hypothetical protein